MPIIKSHKELRVYSLAVDLSLDIYRITKAFPKEERYSMTDQIRRSSRSVCANLAEAWRKRRYERAFISKLSDAEAEAAETQVWLELAQHHDYLSNEAVIRLDDGYEKVLSQIVLMIENPEKWSFKQS